MSRMDELQERQPSARGRWPIKVSAVPAWRNCGFEAYSEITVGT